MRIYFHRHYTDLVRMIGHDGLSEADAREKLQPLIAQYGEAKMRAACAEIVVMDGTRNLAIARLTEHAKTIARALLGPPTRVVPPATVADATPPALVQNAEQTDSQHPPAVDAVGAPVRMARSLVIPRFLDFLRETGKMFTLAEDAKRASNSDEAAPVVLDVILSDPKGNWLIAVRRSLRSRERKALCDLIKEYGVDFRAARVWPVTGDKGWVWKRYPMTEADAERPDRARGEPL